MDWLRRVRRTAVNMALPVLLGLLIIAFDRYYWIAPADRDRVIPDAIKDIAIVVIGVSVVEMVWAILGGAPTEEKLSKLLADLQETRTDIHRDVASMSALTRAGEQLGIVAFGISESALGYPQDEFGTHVYGARSGIDLCGSTLNYIYKSDALITALADAAERNVPVRILLPSPAGDLMVAMFEDRFKNSIKVGIEDLTRTIQSRSRKIQIKHLEAKAMTACILRVDDTMLVMPYMFAYQTAESPRFLIHGRTLLYDKYQAEFNGLFSIAKTA